MSRVLLFRTWGSQRIKILIVFVALTVWSALLPIVYGAFGQTFRDIIESGIIPEELTQFGGGDIFTLSGSISLGAIHPISLILNSVFAVGFATAAIAGERQRGTLEVLLARPLSRRKIYVTLLVATLTFVAVGLLATMLGVTIGSTIAGVLDELPVDRLPLVWLNGFLLFASFAAIGLAASVSFDRLAPAIGVTLGVMVVMYCLEVLGSLWPAAEMLQPYSLFHYLKPKVVLNGAAEPLDFAILGVVIAMAMGWALVVFPRRDLAAPS